MTSEVRETNHFVIPFLALALEAPKKTGGGRGALRSQSGSITDDACDLLQRHVGKNFGYRREDSVTRRRRAIQNALRWWKTEGKAKYTFDYIEKHMMPAAPRPSG